MVAKIDPEDIDLNEPVERMKFIGPYLSQRLLDRNIDICEDLLFEFLMLVEEGGIDTTEIRNRIKDWLQDALSNARQNQCVRSINYLRQGHIYGYKVRNENLMAYNSVLRFWHHNVDPNLRKFIPRPLTGRTSHMQVFPPRCLQD